MSTISGATQSYTQTTTHRVDQGTSGKAGAAAEQAGQAGGRTGDTVEISDEARSLLAGDAAAEPAEPYKPWSFMEYETVLVRDSKEEKEFRDLMKSVKTQKSDLMTRINDVFKKAGISQKDLGKIKIEVDNSGKIVVGGISDAKTARAVEQALNQDKSLGKQLLQFQRDEKELSKQLKEYTGCSLFELTMTAKGDINKRIRGVVEEGMEMPPRDEFYYNLGFLGETLNSVVSAQDVFDLGFQGSIDFSGEVNTLAEPERNIKNEVQALNQKIQDAFAAANTELLDRLEAAGIELTDEMKEKYFLDIGAVDITIDSLGDVQIEGRLAGDEGTHRKGVALIHGLVREMLNKTEDNSYHINVFTDASEKMIQRMTEGLPADEGFDLDTKVVVSINNGIVGDVNVTSPKTEAKLQKSIQDEVNGMLKNSGIALAAPVEIAVDESGRIVAANLTEDTPYRDRIQALLDRINAEVDKTNSSEPGDKDAGEESESRDKTEAKNWNTGIRDIAEHLARLRELREG